MEFSITAYTTERRIRCFRRIDAFDVLVSPSCCPSAAELQMIIQYVFGCSNSVPVCRSNASSFRVRAKEPVLCSASMCNLLRATRCNFCAIMQAFQRDGNIHGCNIFASLIYSRWKACNYCTKKLQHVACNKLHTKPRHYIKTQIGATWRMLLNDPCSAVATVTTATCLKKVFLARSANFPEGLSILPMFFNYFLLSFPAVVNLRSVTN